MLINNRSTIYNIADVILLIWLIGLVFPPITVFYNLAVVNFVCFMSWMIITFWSDPEFYIRENSIFLLSAMFYLLTIILAYVFGSSIIAHRYISLAMIPFGLVIFNFYKKHNHLSSLLRVFKIVIVFSSVTGFITLKALLQNAYISRSIKSSGEWSSALAKQGIGGYSFIYYITAASLLLLFAFLIKIRFRVLFLSTYILSLYLIIKSNYLTAFLLILICSAIMIFLFIVERHSGSLLYVFMLLIVISLSLAILLNINHIFELLLPILPSRIATVFSVGNNSIISSIYEEFVFDRWPTLILSINGLLSHPFFGLLSASKVEFSGGYLTNFGQHSYILDTFALFGIGVGFLNVRVVLSSFKQQSKIGGSKALRISMLLCMIGLYMLNNATESIAMVFGIMYPLLDEQYILHIKKQEN